MHEANKIPWASQGKPTNDHGSSRYTRRIVYGRVMISTYTAACLGEKYRRRMIRGHFACNDGLWMMMAQMLRR